MSGAWKIAATALVLTGCGGPPPSATQEARVTTGVTYYHATTSVGASILTRDDGGVLSERRIEPFGAPLDAVDYAVDPHNPLGKETDPATGWSDHGARWLAIDAARWLTPDPPVKVPDPKFMTQPWDLHPYQYVAQNPVLFWDPDGRERFKQELDIEKRRLRRQWEIRHAAAVARIGGAVPGVTTAPQGASAADIIASLDFNSRLSESAAVIFHPISSLDLAFLRQEAVKAMEQFELGVLGGKTLAHNNTADAFRHAYFSYRLAQASSVDVAKVWGDAHEVSVPNLRSETAMDLWNNAVGRKLAAEHDEDDDPFQVVLNAYQHGQLMTAPAAASPDTTARKADEYIWAQN